MPQGIRAMSMLQRLAAVVITALVAAQFTDAARAEAPLTLEEVATLRERKQNPGQIIRAAKERGRCFAIDEASRNRLKELGFTPTAIAALAKSKEVAPPAAPDPAPAGGDGDVVPPDDPEVAQIDRIVREAVANAGVQLAAWEGQRCRVFGGPGVPPEFVADARQLEAAVTAAFPRAFVAGIDKRAVNVVIVATRSEFGPLLEAVAKAGENNGVRYANEDGRTLAQVGAGKPALYLRGLTTMCLEGCMPDHARRTVAHSIGYHALEHVGRQRAGDALANGFGNITEAMLFKTPGTTVAGGYADREVGGGGGWPEMVRQRFAEQRIQGLERTLAGSFASMEMPDYAEAWSLTDLLCTAPDKFAAAVAAMRGGTEPRQAIVEAYGLGEEAIVGKWRERATGR